MDINFNEIKLFSESIGMAGLTDVTGFSAVRRAQSAVNAIKMSEAMKLWADFREGKMPPYLMTQAMSPTDDFAFRELNRRAPHIFHEAMTRSDFPSLTTYVLDRMLLDKYRVRTPAWRQIARIKPLRDFRTVERWYMDGMEGILQEVGELEGFNRRSASQNKYTYAPRKFEGGYSISWESVINDDMGIFDDFLERLSNGCAYTPEDFVAKLIADANGPHASFYNSGNGNIITDDNNTPNLPLNFINLMHAAAQMMNLTSPIDGIPIDLEFVNVVVADAFQYNRLLNLLNTISADLTVQGGSKGGTYGVNFPPADTTIRVQNWIASRFRPVFMPWLKKVVTTGTRAATSWWLFANPSSGGRPAIEIGQLNGYGDPILFRKAPNALRISGGLDESVGDFETMASEYKALMVFGGTRMDPRMSMASNGTGA